jgi:hypothetical protein
VQKGDPLGLRALVPHHLAERVGALLPDAVDLGEALLLGADDLERVLAEARDDALGDALADPGHEARAEVAHEAALALRHERHPAQRAEATAVGGVLLPAAGEAHQLALDETRELPDDGDGLVVAARPDGEHREAALAAREADRLHRAGDGRFRRGLLGIGHGPRI